MTKEFLQVKFKLYGITPLIQDDLKSNSRLKVGLVGSIPELGSWKIRNMLTAEPSQTEENVWIVTSRLPLSTTSFRWTWFVTGGEERVLHSDPAGNRVTSVNLFSGIEESAWGLAGTRFICETYAVKLRIHYHCKPGEVMAIVGSGESLGFWDPTNAIRAEESPANSSNWVTKGLLDGTLNSYEWKWVVLDSESGSVKRWEERHNRLLEPKCGCLHTFDTRWNCESVSKNRVASQAMNRNDDDVDTAEQDSVANNQMLSIGDQYVRVNWLNPLAAEFFSKRRFFVTCEIKR